MAAPVSAYGPRRRTAIAATLALTALVSAPLLETTVAGQSAAAPASAGEPVDFDAIYRIKDEAVNRSQVMETLSYLTDVHGPRLTNSPNMRSAATWAKQRLESYGLANVALEAWGPFGRGWVNERMVAQMTAPQAFPLLAFPKAWTPGTNGPAKGEAVLAVIEKTEDLEKWKGKLKGKIVLVSPTRAVPAYFESPTRRYDEKGLADLEKPSLDPTRRGRFGPAGPGAPGQVTTDFRKQRMAFFIKEGALALVEMSPGDRGDNGAVRVQAPPEGENMRQTTDAQVLPQIVVAGEHYGRLLRVLDKKIPVELEIDVKNRFVDTDLNSLNVIAELPGSDKADEVVMIGAHFDSWHSGTGATDNGVSSAVMIEAMRILKASGLKTRRTIRMGLWTGEEQGLLGSRAYVTKHFADRADMVLKPEHAKLAAYFNMDNGGGAFRGVFLQGNEAVVPIFEAWMKPFANLGMKTLTIRPTSGTDHLSFDAVGLPGFQFVQDPIEYGSRTHHTNLDVYERAIPDDLVQNAITIATFAYHAANRDQPLPRKPLPKPTPAGATPGQRPATTPAPTASGSAQR
jgi:carboxypeptidase Q